MNVHKPDYRQAKQAVPSYRVKKRTIFPRARALDLQNRRVSVIRLELKGDIILDQKSLYERLGGYDGITGFVND